MALEARPRNRHEGGGNREGGHGGGRVETSPVEAHNSAEDRQHAQEVLERAHANAHTSGGGGGAPAAPAAPAAHAHVGHGGGGFLGFLGKVWGVLSWLGHAAWAATKHIGSEMSKGDKGGGGHAAPKAAGGGGGHGGHH